MAGDEKKGLLSKLFRRKGEEQETAPGEREEAEKGASAPEPPPPEEKKDDQNELLEGPPKDIPISNVPSPSEDKTDIVELEMDIPENEIATVALSLDDLETAVTQREEESTAQGPEEKDNLSFADVQLETAEIEASTEMKLDNVELETIVSVEAAATEIPIHTETVESMEANGQATIPMTLEDVEADLAADDQDAGAGLEIDVDQDEDEEAALHTPFAAGGVREEPAEPNSVVPDEAPIAAETGTDEERQMEAKDQEIIIEEDEEPDFGVTVDEEELASTSRELAGRLGFPELVTQDGVQSEPSDSSSMGEEPPSLDEVSSTGAAVDVPVPHGRRDTPLQLPDQITEGLGIDNHVSALSSFVMNCQTPLCISIQGESGSGKTSLMSLIAKNLDDSQCLTAWFTSRDYSRFSDAKEVPALLIRRMLHTIEKNVAKDKLGFIRQMVDEALPLMNVLWKAGFLIDARGMATIEIDDSADALAANGDTDAIAGLKIKLRDIVHQGLVSGEKERIVMFVDDVDRIGPSLALDLLETIGTFLKIERCVFVVACDRGTIERGIQAASSSDVVADAPGSYYDRVFQLSVSLPAPLPRFREYVRDLLESARFDYSEETLDDFLPLLQYSVGVNPRRIKRLANRLVFAGAMKPELYTAGDSETGPRYLNQKLLLALGCLDSEFGPVFQLLFSNRNNDRELRNLIDERLRDDAQIKDLDKRFRLFPKTVKTETRINKLIAFMDLFSDLAHAGDANRRLGQENLQMVKQAINLISMTATLPAEVSHEDSGRSALTEFCMRVKRRLNQMAPNLAPDGSDKSIRSLPSPRPWFGLWYTDDVTKKVWGQHRVYYELSVDSANRNTVSVSLKCNTTRLADFGVDRVATDRLKKVSVLDKGFRIKEHDSGWVEIVKLLDECTWDHIDEVNDDQVESIATAMKDLVLATHDVFDARPPVKVLQPDKQQLFRRSLPPCKACGSELKEVTTKDGSVGFRCDKCRKIYKPKSAKSEDKA